MTSHRTVASLTLAVALLAAAPALAQAPAGMPPGGPPGAAARLAPPPRPASAVVAADGSVTFRIRAPEAKAVSLRGEFLSGFGSSLALTKTDQDVWSATTAPLAPGAYRYTFTVDGVTTLDAANTATSASRDNVQSVVFVPGLPMEANAPATPHGAVSVTFYPSQFGGGQRRVHIYTPPGYETGKGVYPTLYLIHGGGDGDNSWSTVGRAGFILDNLIAAGKAKPMIVVMPDGNAGPAGQVMTGDPANEPFVGDMIQSLIPFVEKTYRVVKTADGRALAGLSMGGIQTMNVGFSNLDTFHSLGIFSSGFFPADEKVFAEKMAPQLRAAPRKLKVFYMAWGETDIARPQAENNVKLFKANGLEPVIEVTDRGHEWYNWRRYLVSFAPRLFR